MVSIDSCGFPILFALFPSPPLSSPPLPYLLPFLSPLCHPTTSGSPYLHSSLQVHDEISFSPKPAIDDPVQAASQHEIRLTCPPRSCYGNRRCERTRKQATDRRGEEVYRRCNRARGQQALQCLHHNLWHFWHFGGRIRGRSNSLRVSCQSRRRRPLTRIT